MVAAQGCLVQLDVQGGGRILCIVADPVASLLEKPPVALLERARALCATYADSWLALQYGIPWRGCDSDDERRVQRLEIDLYVDAIWLQGARRVLAVEFPPAAVQEPVHHRLYERGIQEARPVTCFGRHLQ